MNCKICNANLLSTSDGGLECQMSRSRDHYYYVNTNSLSSQTRVKEIANLYNLGVRMANYANGSSSILPSSKATVDIKINFHLDLGYLLKLSSEELIKKIDLYQKMQ